MYLTQNKEVSAEERIFVKEVFGSSTTLESDWRVTTAEEKKVVEEVRKNDELYG